VVRGLSDFPREDWPPVPIVHLSFQVMIGCGTLLVLVALWGAYLILRKRAAAESPRFLRALLLAGPLGLIALEAGWMVTEVGRQPFIIQGVMRVRDAVTPVPGLVVSLVVTTLLYLLLGGIVLVMLARHVLSVPASQGENAP
jgi:cytochrome d ubiquinol oxidase subunit I